MNNKNKSTKILFLRKKLINYNEPSKYFSFSNTDRYKSKNKVNLTKFINNQTLIRNNERRKSTIQINYKGSTTKVSKVDYYKMKNVDITKLAAYKKEIIELIKQKKLFAEKEYNIFNAEKMDLISKLKEEEYRREIRNLQKKLLFKNEQKNELYQYYGFILLIIKDIEKKITSESEKQRQTIENIINSDINELDIDFEKKFNKKCELSDYLVYNIKELIEKMNIILNSHQALIDKRKGYNQENIILKKKIKDMNKINNNICKKIKNIKECLNKKENDSINEADKLLSLFYKKIQNNTGKKYIDRVNKGKNQILGRKILLNNEINIGQTFYTSNNMNLLTNKSNSKNNILSLSNNLLSITNTSLQNQENSNDKINIKEINYINRLKNSIKSLKTKIKQMKMNINKPKNAFYNLIIKIMKQLNEEQNEKVIDNIDYKLLNENMKMFPSQNYNIRKKFLDQLLMDINLYKILNSKNLEGISYFKFNLFEQGDEKLAIK